MALRASVFPTGVLPHESMLPRISRVTKAADIRLAQESNS
jgi:hypothetical protein